MTADALFQFARCGVAQILPWALDQYKVIAPFKSCEARKSSNVIV
jgi:hypothetical protein